MTSIDGFTISWRRDGDDRIVWTTVSYPGTEFETRGEYHANRTATFQGHDLNRQTSGQRQCAGGAWTPWAPTDGGVHAAFKRRFGNTQVIHI